MKQDQVGCPGLAVVHGLLQGTANAAYARLVLIAMNQEIVAARTPDNLLSEVTREFLSSTAPEDDPPVTIDQIDTGRQGFQDSPVRLRAQFFQ
jgi:hypothetical protein